MKAADDPEVRVRFQAAIALGDLDDDDDWVRLAVLSGLGEKAQPFLHALLVAQPGWLAAPTFGQGRVLSSTAAILGARNRPEELRSLAAQLAPAPGETAVACRIALLVGLSDGLARAGRPLHELLKPGPAAVGYEGIAALLDRAAKTIASAEAAPADRAQSLTLLARCRPEAAVVDIPALLLPGQADVVQSTCAGPRASSNPCSVPKSKRCDRAVEP